MGKQAVAAINGSSSQHTTDDSSSKREYDFNIHPESFLKSMSSSLHKQFPVPLEQQQNILNGRSDQQPNIQAGHQSIKNEPVIHVENSQDSTGSAMCQDYHQEKAQQDYEKEAMRQAYEKESNFNDDVGQEPTSTGGYSD